jgi:phosphoribosylformylglycinamidine (FGAM) synthase-like enzyme
MCIQHGVGASVDVAKVSSEGLSPTEVLFSESHGRFVVSSKTGSTVETLFANAGVPYSRVGKTGARSLKFTSGGKLIAALGVDAIRNSWETPLGRIMG